MSIIWNKWNTKTRVSDDLSELEGLKYTCSALDKRTTIVSNEFKLGETK